MFNLLPNELLPNSNQPRKHKTNTHTHTRSKESDHHLLMGSLLEFLSLLCQPNLLQNIPAKNMN